MDPNETPVTPKPPRKDRILGQRTIWKSGLQMVRDARRQFIGIALVGLILPQLAIQAFFDVDGLHVAQTIRDHVAALEANPGNFHDIMASAALYFSSYLTINILYTLVFIASYCAMVQVCVESVRGQTLSDIGQAFSKGLKIAFPRGIFVLIIYAFLFTIGQVLIFPFIIVAALGMMIPVILIIEEKTAMRAFLDAVTIKYARHTAFSAWNIMFALLTIAAIIYTGIMGASLLNDFFLHLDESFGMSRTLWTAMFFDTGLTTVYVLGTLATTVATTFLVTLMPALTTAAYFEVVAPRPIDQA